MGLSIVGLPAAPAIAAPAAAGWLHTEGARIVDADDDRYIVKAVNWFGLETANCAPHGLWQISLDDGLAQIASFGFNTIRLPFSNECIAGSTTSGIDAAKKPGLVGKTPLQVMDAVIAGAAGTDFGSSSTVTARTPAHSRSSGTPRPGPSNAGSPTGARW